tara:strand:- start:447 stop:1292 length:846 start_codon:yes stop_codon:yes gene_type:complete
MAIQIGIELEMLNVTGNEVIEAWQEAGVNYSESIHGYHQGPSCTSGLWKMERDGSLTGRTATYDTKGALEVISPILYGASDINTMNRFLTAIKRKGATVDRSCGTHITVGLNNKARFNNMSADKKCNMANYIIDLYNHFSPVFNAMSPNVRNMHENSYMPAPRNVEMAYGRLHGGNRGCVNVSKFITYGCIEFRQPGYTLDKKKIQLWLKIINKIISAALNENHVSRSMSLREMPRTIEGFSTYLGLSNMVETMLRARVQQLRDNHRRFRESRDAVLGGEQ